MPEVAGPSAGLVVLLGAGNPWVVEAGSLQVEAVAGTLVVLPHIVVQVEVDQVVRVVCLAVDQGLP